MTTPAATSVRLPHEFAVRNLFEDLVGRDVAVAHSSGPATEDGRGLLVVYRDGDGDVAAAAGLDLPLVCAAGAALGLIPAPVASEQAAAGRPGPDVLANALELCNVLVATFGRGENATPIRLTGHHLPASGADAPLRELVTRHTDRLDLTVRITGYPAGLLSLAVAAQA